VQELVEDQVEDLRQRIETAVLEFSLNVRGGGQARVGISVGTATYGTDGETLDQLLVAADQAMYRAKSSHKLDKISKSQLAEARKAMLDVELDTTNLAAVTVN
jgi:diguanylate cyclase (GGDEF)-like protein